MTEDISWTTKYLTVPFVLGGRDWDGCDCWGLNRLALFTEKSISIPSYDDRYKKDSFVDAESRKVVDELIDEEKNGGSWVPIRDRDRQVWDVVMYRIRGALNHVGIYVGSGRVLLTCQPWKRPRLELADRMIWKNNLDGYFRHKQLL